MTFDFTDSVVLVTGAAAGIGQGIAQAFHAAGARVALGDVREGRLGAHCLPRWEFGTCSRTWWTCATRGEVTRFVTEAEKALGPVTVAVANAGIYPNTARPRHERRGVGPRHGDQRSRSLPHLPGGGPPRWPHAGVSGKIITISSGAYGSGRVGASHYCASKAAVVMFTRVLALELAAQRINVNCIAPGLVKVDSETLPSQGREYGSRPDRPDPLGPRSAPPLDIANAALFLASPYADYVTGEVLAVNGGTSAGRAFLPLSTPKA